MKIAIYIGKKGLEEDRGFKTLVDELAEGGCGLVYLADGELLPDDVDMLQDMVIAAVNEALRAAETDKNNNMSRMTGGLNLGGLF